MRNNRKPCPLCGEPMHRQSPRCLSCARKDPNWRKKLSEMRKGKPSYERSPEWRENMSQKMKGKKKGYPSASTRPEVAAKIQAWWTPDRREAKRQEVLKRNPLARYHGLSAKAAQQIVQAMSKCENCGHDGSVSRLGIHHRDRNKHNQTFSNLQVLCHRCHMKEHRNEIGWAVYHDLQRKSQD